MRFKATSEEIVYTVINCFTSENWVEHSMERLSSVNTDNIAKCDVPVSRYCLFPFTKRAYRYGN